MDTRSPQPKPGRLDGNWTGMRRYEVSKGSSKSRILSQPVHVQDEIPNHGDSKTLADFLAWGMKNYPARHTMLVVGDHGKGFEGTGFDYHHKDQLDLKELKAALGSSHPDLLVMDACEMGSVEVAYQLRDSAQFLVASEEIIGTMGLPHQDFLGHLVTNPKVTPRQLAVDLVNLSGDDSANRVDKGKPQAAEQLAAIRLDRLEALAEAMHGLGRSLAASDIPRARLKEMIEETQHFNGDSKVKPDSDYRDISHFCELLAEEPEPVASAAARVQKSLQAALLANHCQGEDVTEGNGLSVYLPATRIKQSGRVKSPDGKGLAGRQLKYQDLDFDRATGWSAWLEKRF
ncbi:MAG: clostripain-related cysteine peptidase [Vulcanimicrobiota bacterium]